MKKISRRSFLQAAGTTCVAGALAACGNETASSTAPSAVSTTASSVDANSSAEVEPATELVFWSTKDHVFQDYLDEFKAETGITVTGTYMGGYDDMVNKVMAGIAGNNLPDVAQLGQRHGVAQMYDSGNLVPVTDVVAPELIDDIFEGFWTRFTYKGEKIVLPFANSMPVLYYNKDLLAQAGVTPPETFAELMTTAKTIKDETSVYGFGFASDTTWYIHGLLFNSESVAVLDDTANINTPEMKAIFESFNQMATVDQSMPANQHATAKEDFYNGTIAMLFTSCSSYASIKSSVGDNFELGVAMMPTIKTLDAPMGGNGLGVFASDAAKQKAVGMFIEFMLNKDRVADNTVNSGYIPVTYAAMETDVYQEYLKDPNCQVIHDQLQSLGGAPVNPADSLVWGELGSFLETVEANAIVDYDKELAEINNTVQEYLDDYAG